jgi:DNA-binding IclR family transcriptional regulator
MLRPFLAGLSDKLGETVDLAVPRADCMVFLDQVIGPQRLRAVSFVGERFPLYCTANGKAYLAELPTDEIERLVGRTYPPRTPSTITSLDGLLRDLTMVRQTGVALDQEEHTVGICAVGVAMRSPLGEHVAMSVPVPAPRFYGRQQFIAETLLEAKHKIRNQLNRAS